MVEPPAQSSLFPLGDYLLRAGSESPAATHILSVGTAAPAAALSYGDSLRAARAIAAGLLAAGLQPGEGVALLSDPCPLQIQASFAIWLAGGVLTPLDPQWEPEAHGRALSKARIRLGLGHPARLAALGNAATGIAGFSALDLEAAASSGLEPGALPKTELGARALVLFTSGTTGEPKAAVLSHQALAWNAASMLRLIGAGEQDNILSVLPLHHVFGLLASVTLPPMVRARVTFPPTLKGADISRTMRETGVTVVAAVPQLLLGIDRAIQARIAQQPALKRSIAHLFMSVTGVARSLGVNPGPFLFSQIHDSFGRKLRFLGSAGAALDAGAAQRLWSLGLNVVEGYGMTETGPALSFDSLARPEFGSVGRALPGVELRTFEPDASGVGEIIARTPSAFEGYLDAPEATAEVLREGWIHTGDLGRIDADGRLWITGRKKEVIVLGSGKNVYPHEVELRLDESRYIKESCVLGLAEGDQRGSEKLHAVLVPDLDEFRKAGESRISLTLNDEVIRIGDALPSHHRVVGFTVRSTPLPRTPLGKLRRFQVERELRAELSGATPKAAAVAASPEPESPYWPAISGALAQVSSRREAIGLETSIELDLGLDSLARVEALGALEERLGQKLPEGFGGGCFTAGELLAEVERHFAGTGNAPAAHAQGLASGANDAELSSWSRRLLRPLGLVVIAFISLPLWVLGKLLWHWQVHGREHLPGGAFLVCPNHGSYADAAFILLALPWHQRIRMWAIGDHEIFSNPALWLLGRMGNVIRSQGGAGLKAMIEAGGAVLKTGAPLVIFPEGSRAPVGERLPFRRGAAILALTHGVAIVPAWMEGMDRLLPRGTWKPNVGHRMAVRFGAPIDPRDFAAAADPGAALTEALRERVLALAAEERRAGGASAP